MPEEVAIRVENVSKNFILPHEKISSVKGLFTSAAKKRNGKSETQHALKDISFEIKKGEFFGIVGRNGSGKSTLLKILAGIYQPTSGKVSTAGKLVPFIELGVGFNPELTGRENVYLNGAMLGFSEKEVSKMYKDIVEFAELERFMDQKLKNYSSGMQVRLAFSMATRSEADILLIDEVLAVGDADFQRKCYEYFGKLKKSNITVIFISHDMSAVREYCDRAVLIDDSKIVNMGDPDVISQDYQKLFNQVQHKAGNNPERRWGDESVRIIDAQASASETNLIVKTTIKAARDFEKPVAGIRITDSSGTHITGTNTKIERIVLPDLAKNQTMKIDWQIPNVFRDGDYDIDLTIQYGDAITVADWWDGAASVSIKKSRRLPYIVDTGFRIDYL
jgi:ABC-2 type transport system ATP-binding protein